jgi:hypothetical protein
MEGGVETDEHDNVPAHVFYFRAGASSLPAGKGGLAMHAIVTTVRIAQGQFENARRELKDQVIPRVRQTPGFLKGFWTRSADGAIGTSMVVYDTQQQAEEAAKMVRNSPTPPGVTFNSVDVCEVVAEA